MLVRGRDSDLKRNLWRMERKEDARESPPRTSQKEGKRTGLPLHFVPLLAVFCDGGTDGFLLRIPVRRFVDRHITPATFRPPSPSEDSFVGILSHLASPRLVMHPCRIHVHGSTSTSPWTMPAPLDTGHQVVSRPFHRVSFPSDPRMFGFRPDPLKGILGQQTRRVGIDSTPHVRG